MEATRMTPEVKIEVAKILEAQAKATPRIDIALGLRSLIMKMTLEHYAEQI
jgi:hypothetical protein